jgi:esterase/lipase superfamily enzyme
MNREYHQWFSNALHRNMELLVFGHGGRSVLFFPTRMARFYDYENWGIVGALHDKLERGELQLFCVDSIDAESFYNQELPPWARIRRHLKYEQYILQEVIPLIQHKNQNNYLEVAGCSMGAYHAVNLGLKHPELFNKIVGMSGRYDLTHQSLHFRNLFDGYHDETIYFNMPEQFMANLENENILHNLRKLEIILAIGETDAFLSSNRELCRLLSQRGVPNQLYVWEGEAHRPRYWRQMVRWYL